VKPDTLVSHLCHHPSLFLSILISAPLHTYACRSVAFLFHRRYWILVAMLLLSSLLLSVPRHPPSLERFFFFRTSPCWNPMQPGHNLLFRCHITRLQYTQRRLRIHTHTPLQKLTQTNKEPYVGQLRRTTPVFFAQSRTLVNFDTYKGSPQRLPIRPIFFLLVRLGMSRAGYRRPFTFWNAKSRRTYVRSCMIC